MSYKFTFYFSVFVFLFISCTRKDKFPPLHSEKTPIENVVLNKSLFPEEVENKVDSILHENSIDEISGLLEMKQRYLKKDISFDLDIFEKEWIKIKMQEVDFNSKELKKWIEITGFLLELTGNGLYATEIENIILHKRDITKLDLKEVEKLLIPYIFTKNVDHIHINLFANATVEYEHSLSGKVKITQETEYPKNGEVQLKFNMEKRRYIELFIRIPEWAKGATVTVKKVKYFAPPGGYCLIAKKWKEGDLVEIEFPF